MKTGDCYRADHLLEGHLEALLEDTKHPLTAEQTSVGAGRKAGGGGERVWVWMGWRRPFKAGAGGKPTLAGLKGAQVGADGRRAYPLSWSRSEGAHPHLNVITTTSSSNTIHPPAHPSLHCHPSPRRRHASCWRAWAS